MKLVDKFRTLGVRTNADTPQDAKVARQFGAEGIGLFRTEHMFYGAGSDQPLFLLRKMILSKTVDERKAALGRVVPLRQAEHQGHAGSDGRPAGHDPAVGSAAARVRAAGPGQAEGTGRLAGHSPVRHQETRRGPARDQPHDGPPRRAAGHHLSGSDRDAGPGDLRGGRRTEEGRQVAQARTDGPGHLRREGTGRHQGDLRPREEGSRRSRRASRCLASTAR